MLSFKDVRVIKSGIYAQLSHEVRSTRIYTDVITFIKTILHVLF